MPNTITSWEPIHGQSLHNLHVAINDEKGTRTELGFIYRPKNTGSDKNAWRVHLGIGESEQFIGHAWHKRDAKKMLQEKLDAPLVA